MTELVFDPCAWLGHAYIHSRVTAEGRQVHVCARCGATYEQWTSNQTTTQIVAPSPGRGGSA